MTIKFSIEYNTGATEAMYVTGSSVLLGSNNISKALKLSRNKDGIWEGEIKPSLTKERVISYKYFIKGNDGIHYEAGKGRSIARISGGQ